LDGLEPLNTTPRGNIGAARWFPFRKQQSRRWLGGPRCNPVLGCLLPCNARRDNPTCSVPAGTRTRRNPVPDQTLDGYRRL